MNAPIEPLVAQVAEQADTPSNECAVSSHWLLVTQYRSDRLVYFTDDPEFTMPADADWCYLSPYVGELPQGMTLRNCWGWRFRGMAFIDARQAQPANPVKALLDHNKEALRKLLREKVDALRHSVAPSNLMGEHLRARKLAEAQRVLAGDAGDVGDAGHANAGALALLPNAAAARNITLANMAQLVLAAHDHTEQLLLHTELQREQLAVAIEQARTQEALMHIRTRLMEDLAPQTGAQAAIQPEHTTPQAQTKPPSATELAQEQLRLRVQLRLKINELRRTQVSDYLLDDVVLRHKGRIAEAVLKAGGALPPGLDGSPLISHAAARGQALVDAARDVVHEMADVAQTLLHTEQVKDAALARIATLNTFAEIEAMGRAIAQIAQIATAAAIATTNPTTPAAKAS